MADRLKKVPPVIDVDGMKTDFERHLLVRSHMMKKFPGQMKKSQSKSGGSPGGSVEESSHFGMVISFKGIKNVKIINLIYLHYLGFWVDYFWRGKREEHEFKWTRNLVYL